MPRLRKIHLEPCTRRGVAGTRCARLSKGLSAIISEWQLGAPNQKRGVTNQVFLTSQGLPPLLMVPSWYLLLISALVQHSVPTKKGHLRSVLSDRGGPDRGRTSPRLHSEKSKRRPCPLAVCPWYPCAYPLCCFPCPNEEALGQVVLAGLVWGSHVC